MLEKQIVQLLAPLVTDTEHLKIAVKQLLSVPTVSPEDVAKSLRSDAEFVASLRGADGKHADQDAIIEALKAHVQHGRDGKSVSADEVIQALKADAEFIKALQGKDGASVDPLAIIEALKAHVQHGRDGRDGTDGKSLDPEEFLQKYGHHLRGKDGVDGLDGRDGKHGIGIKSLTQSADLRELEIEFDNGEVVTVELPAIKGEKGDTGGTGLGMDAEAWEPEGIYVEDEIVQHHFGRMYRATKRTTGEPGESPDWVRVGQCGIRNTGGFKKDHAYEIGDIYVKDFSTYLWDGKKANLIAARQKETPAIDVARELLEMPKLLDSVIKGLIDPLTEQASLQIKELVKSAVADAQKSPFYKGDDGQWYIIPEGQDAQEIIPKELMDLAAIATNEDKKPPLRRFAGAFDMTETYVRGDVVQYGNQLWVCFESGRHDMIERAFVLMLNSTVIGGSGGGGGGGASLPQNPFQTLALLASDVQQGHHWIDGAGLITVYQTINDLNLIPAAERVPGKIYIVQDVNPPMGEPGMFRYEKGAFVNILPAVPQDNRIRSLEWNPVTRRIEWTDVRNIPATVSTEADLHNTNVLPIAALVTGKLVFVRDTGTLYEFISTQATRTGTIADWSPLVDKVNHYARIGNLPNPLTASPPLQDGQMAYVDFDIGAAWYGRLFVYDKANNRWNPVNTKVWIKDSRTNPDQATDQNRGDFNITLENLHKEIKVHDGTAWQKVYSEDDVKAWIAAASQFRGTAENDGHGTIGSIDFSNLPAQDTLGIGNKGWYWTFVGASGHVIAPNEIGGKPSGIDGARLSVGDWLQVAETVVPVYNTPGDPNSGIATPGVYQYVHIPGDLLSKGRGDGLYGLNTWVQGAYEMGSLVVHQGDVWKANSAVLLADNQPGAVIAARPQITRITLPAVLAPGSTFSISIATTPTASVYTTTVGAAETTTQLVTRVIAEINALAAMNTLVTASVVNAAPRSLDLTSVANAPLPAVTLSAGVTQVLAQSASNGRNSWTKLDISGGVKTVSSDPDLPTTGVANGTIYLVLASARAGGKQALYSWDAVASAWQELGGGGVPLQLTGGRRIASIGVPVGSVLMWPANVLPPGYLLCDGAKFNPVVYPELFAVLGADSTPDLRGQFIRGAPTATLDNFAKKRWTTGLPRNEFALTDSGSHTHGMNTNRGTTPWRSGGVSDAALVRQIGQDQTGLGGLHSHRVVGGGDPETAPDHVLLHYLIKCDDNHMSLKV